MGHIRFFFGGKEFYPLGTSKHCTFYLFINLQLNGKYEFSDNGH